MNSKPAAVILCGGVSQRMGFPKWKLPWGNSTLLQNTIDLLRPVTSRVVISIHDQPAEWFTEFSADGVVADQHQGCGPLEGIRASLAALENDAESAFVTACDVPQLNPAIVKFLVELLSREYEAVIPVIGQRVFGMTAVYRTNVHEKVESLVRDGQLRVSHLVRVLKTRIIDGDAIRSVDEELKSLENINHPQEYLEVLRSTGAECPADLRKQLGLAE